MAIPVARVHLAMAHAALPALLPTPPKWKMLPLLPTAPYPCVAAVVLPKPLATKPCRADSDKRWDARKTTKPASAVPSPSPSSSGPRSRSAGSVRSSAGHGSQRRKNATSPPPKPGRADSVERWDAHKKAASPASLPPSSSSSRTSSHVSRSSKCPISRAPSGERWDAHKERRPPQADQQLDDVESSSTGSNDVDTEVIVRKLRAMYAGPGFAAAAPNPACFPCQQPSWFPLHSCAARGLMGSGCLFLQLGKPMP